MKPQISLKLIFSFSFLFQISQNSGKEAGWRIGTFYGGGRRKVALVWVQRNITLLTATIHPDCSTCFPSVDLVPPLEAGLGSSPSSNHQSRIANSASERKNIGIYVNPLCLKLCFKWCINNYKTNSLGSKLQLLIFLNLSPSVQSVLN